jgi:general stress protein 26
MDVSSFADIEEEFMNRVKRIVWCTVTTVDTKGRPRARLLHPIWEGGTGWIATGRNSHKAKHIESTPYVSLSYWDPEHQQIYAECKAEWVDDMGEKKRLWDLFKSTPEPLGYDLKNFWKSVDDPTYGLLKLTPWRLEVSALSDMMTGQEPKVWRGN